MFVLYFEIHEWDDAEFGIIAVSKDKEKLEMHKKELMEKTKNIDDFRVQEHKKRSEDFFKHQKTLREFLERNKHALKSPYELKDWKNPNYNLTDEEWNQYIDELKNEIIDNICQYSVSKFKKDCEYYRVFMDNTFFLDKLSEPLPEFEFYVEKMFPPDEIAYYEPESLKITEVIEL
jgi:poly(3-hydroxyalkanoate) synthetase